MSRNIILFLIGTFSMTQVRIIGSIGISEAILFIVAPFVFARDYGLLRKDGFMVTLFLSLMSLVGCCMASLYNHIDMPFALRGCASTYSIFAGIVCFHSLLRNNYNGIRWFLVGFCLTGVINTFFFQTSVESQLYADFETGINAAEGIMSSPIYWIKRVTPFVSLPYRGWYLSVPLVYSAMAPLCMAAFSILTSTSGRSAALGLIGSAAMVVVGGKRIYRMRNISRGFVKYFIFALIGIWVANFGYRWAATNGVLGEKAQLKYEQQTHGSSSILKLLMGGRLPFFVGLYAGCKQPIVGYGPWAVDHYGYLQYFLSKYGTQDDYEAYLNSAVVTRGKIEYIPAHSHIIGSWISNGILGLLFWLYVLYKIFEYVRRNLSAVPQWYGLLAAGIPPLLWDIFFSPYTSRVYFPFYFTLILFANGIARGKISMPSAMIKEIIENESKSKR